MPDHSLIISVLPDAFAVCRLDPASALPDWAMRDGFFSITRTADELSIVCHEEHAPREGVTTGVSCEWGWRAFKLEGPFDFGQIGILASIAKPLAEARVSIFALSTYDTDYVFVKAAQFEQAVTALTRFGHTVKTSAAGTTETIAVKCAWRLPNDSRVRATFDAEVMAYDAKQDRWLVKLAGVRVIEPVDTTTRTLIEAQVGKWAYVPSEARRGLTLPLKYETLTGEIRYFYTDDPRRDAKGKSRR